MPDPSDPDAPTVYRAGETTAADLPARDRSLPERVGPFRVLRKLGRGGMAEVYLAEQDGLKRQVALKVLRPDKLADGAEGDVMIRRFEQEALAAAALNHPNIVQVHSVGSVEAAALPGWSSGADGRPVHYIAQEYVAGPTLREYLKKKGPPGAKVALKLLRQTADALAAAAEAGVVHRDIKPENILLTKRGEAKVADFGLARLTDRGEESGPALTQEGMTLGTPLYMSPEQVRGDALDARSDLYSLGVTAYHLLSGAPPFRGENPMAIAMKHISEEPRPLAQTRPDLPPVVCEIVAKLMSKSPGGRYDSAAALLEDLDEVAAALNENPAAARKLRLAKLAGAKSVARSDWPLKLDRFFDWPLGRHLAFLIPVCLLIAAAGAGLGWANRPPDPFLAPPAAPRAPKLATAREQFAQALLANDERGWLALLEYYGDDINVAATSRDRLARWYLDVDRTAAARRQAGKQLAAAALGRLPRDREAGLKANAKAVQALADLRDGAAAAFRRNVSSTLTDPLLRTALDDDLARRIAAAVARDRAGFDAATHARWEEETAGELE